MRNLDLLVKFLVHTTSGNREEAEKLLSSDFTVSEVESLPYGGVYKGARGWWKLNALVNSYWQFNEVRLVEASECVDSGNVFLIAHLFGRCRSNGLEIETRVCELWRFSDGLIASVEPFFWDTALLQNILNSTEGELASPISGGGFAATRMTTVGRLTEVWDAAKLALQ